jgi:hypothetical protein
MGVIRFSNKTQSSRQKGQALFEFALVLLIFLAMVYMLFEVGRAVFIYQSILTASQEAARWGSATEGTEGPQYLDCDAIKDEATKVGDLAQIDDDDIEIWYDHWDEDLEEFVVDGDCGDLGEDDIHRGYRIVVEVTGYFDPVAPIMIIDFPAFEFTATASRSIIKEVQLDS